MSKHSVIPFIITFFLFPVSASAYIGPGAGILLLGPMFTMLAAVGVAILMLLLWPLMVLRRKRKKAKESTSVDSKSSSETPNQQ